MPPIIKERSALGECSPSSLEGTIAVTEFEEKQVSTGHSFRGKTRLATDLSPRKRTDRTVRNTGRRNTSSPQHLAKSEGEEYKSAESSWSSPIRGADSVVYTAAAPFLSRFPTSGEENLRRVLSEDNDGIDTFLSQKDPELLSTSINRSGSNSEVEGGPNVAKVNELTFKDQKHDGMSLPVQTTVITGSGPKRNCSSSPRLLVSDKPHGEILIEDTAKVAGTNQHEIPMKSVVTEENQRESSSEGQSSENLTLHELGSDSNILIKDFLSDVPDSLQEVEQKVNIFRTQFDSLQSYLVSISDQVSSSRSFLRRSLDAQSRKLCLSLEQLDESSSVISSLNAELDDSKRRISEEQSLTISLKNEADILKQSIKSASLEIDALKDVINDKSEEGRKLKLELDSLNNELDVRNDQFQGLQQSLENKEATIRSLSLNLGNLVKETQILNDEMTLIEAEHNTMKSELTEKSSMFLSLKSSHEDLDSQCRRYKQESKTLKINLTALEADRENLAAALSREREQADAHMSQVKEKNEIISGHTERLHALEATVESQKREIAEFDNTLRDVNHEHMLSQNELLNQLELLKDQIVAAQEKGDDRIQKIAEQLYHQYSKKHETKTNQLRQNYDVKLREKSHQIEEFQKQIENLESRLRIETKEKEYVLSMLENGIRE